MAGTITRVVRVEPSLLDGPIMDRGGVTFVRLRINNQRMPPLLRLFEYLLTDTSGKRKRERVEIAIFYESHIVVAATFTVRLALEYVDLEGGRVEVVYEPATRRGRTRVSVGRGTLDASSELHGPISGKTQEYIDFLDAPPEEQRPVAVGKDGTLELPPAPEAR
jgi:hypothetical protein